LLLCFMLVDMPLAWIHDLSKQQAEELARQMGLSVDGTLDDLRKRLKQKWTALQPYWPSPSAVKPSLVSEPNSLNTDFINHECSYLGKVKSKLVSDLIKNVPLLTDTNPKNVVKFLIRVTDVYELNLVSDSEFMSLLVCRTTGRVTQILGAYLGTAQNWAGVRSLIVSTFLPPRVKEKHLGSYVLERFQSSSEDMNSYIMSVVAAADILGFVGSESQLVHRMLQNMHPRVKSHLLFASKPESVQELFSLTTTVAEAVAVEEQRKLQMATTPQTTGSPQAEKGMSRRSHSWPWPIERLGVGDVAGGATSSEIMLKGHPRIRIQRDRETPPALGSKWPSPSAESGSISEQV
jgi:hypothetical protein